jgi:uncharacterized protein DUF4389
MTGEAPAAPPPGEPPAKSSAQPPVVEPPAGPPAPPGDGPPPDRARVFVRDDLQRSRLTVFFRLILAIPHFIVLALFGVLAFVLAIVSWFAILFTGKSVGYDMQERYLRYWTHVYGYVYLAANPYPGFGGESGSYAVDSVIPPEELPHNRWKTGFRFVLILPALMLASALGTIGSLGGSYGNYYSYGFAIYGVLPTAAFLAWFACVIRGRMPRGFRDVTAYCLNYGLQLGAYFLLITDRYPTSDPLYPDYGDDEEVPRDHPIRISADDDLRRSRLTVFFRLLLALPHIIWLALWGLVVFFTVIANWFVTLFAGHPADALHRFNGAYVRYLTHVFAYLFLVANLFPGFVGAPGTYPVDLEIGPAERQNRWKTGFRLILIFPAALVSSALGGALYFVAIFGWFVGLFTARMPLGLRNLGVYALRYQAQVNGYLFLLTDRYPFSGPSLEQPAAEPAPLPEPV